MQNDFMTVKEARQYLGVSKQKMARLIKEAAVEVYRDPLDKRVKLVRSSDLDRLKEPRR